MSFLRVMNNKKPDTLCVGLFIAYFILPSYRFNFVNEGMRPSMTESNKTESQVLSERLTDTAYAKTIWDGKQLDGLLQYLVGLTNHTAIKIGITLHVSGSIITGDLVSITHYHDQLASDFSSGFASGGTSQEIVDQMRAAILSMAPVVDPSKEDQLAPQYLHLENAFVLMSADTFVPANKGLLWRGKISSVSGFTVGKLLKGTS